MNELRCFFNLIAILIAKARQFEAYRRMQTISDDEAVRVKDFVDGIIFLNFNPSVKDVKKRLSITEKDVEEILEALKDKHFYYFSALITRLDKLLSAELLYDLLKPNPFSGDNVSDNYFESLNDNVEQTQIYIFPNIPAINTCTEKQGKFFFRKARLENDLKSSLENIYFLDKAALKGYKIVNAVLDCKLKKKNFVTLAVTPLCNIEQNRLIKVNHFVAKHDGVDVKLFSVELQDPDGINEKFKKVLLKCADEGDVDIILGPEMLGTKEFSDTDRFGFNGTLRELVDKPLPKIIIPPTYSHNSTNVLSVFSDSGEKLGEQHKQEPFDDKKSKEDLLNAKREILVLHIYGIGRVCFLICKDFLTDYADVIIKELKANLILCPSYSRSAASFNASKNIATGHNCRVVWINCCSAFDKRDERGAFIGFAAGNYLPESTAKFNCTESNECDSCYFKIRIPLNASSGQFYNDKKIIIQHKRIQ